MSVIRTELSAGTVGEAMHAGVVTCSPATSLRGVARIMAAHRIHAVVVLGGDEGLEPWGVVSDLDLVGAIGSAATAGEIAASPVVRVTPDLPLEHATTLFSENETTHLLVTDDGGLPIGVLSTLDVAEVYA